MNITFREKKTSLTSKHAYLAKPKSPIFNCGVKSFDNKSRFCKYDNFPVQNDSRVREAKLAVNNQ